MNKLVEDRHQKRNCWVEVNEYPPILSIIKCWIEVYEHLLILGILKLLSKVFVIDTLTAIAKGSCFPPSSLIWLL